MSTTKFMLIIIVCSLLIIAGVVWLTYVDINKAKEDIAVKERESETLIDKKDEENIRSLIKEADLSQWKLENHRLELEQLLRNKEKEIK